MAFRRALQSLIIGEDAFGLVVNQDQRWRFRTEAQKVEEFRGWIESQLKTDILGDDKLTSDDWWQRYVEEGYRKGTGRAFDDTKKPALSADEQKSVSDFYRGTKEEFLRSSFARPESVEKIKLLAGRVLTDLKGVTGYMAQQMVRELTDGLARGENPRTIARRMVKSLDIAKGRATTIARTEIVRAHAEGQLDGLERLGVTEVGVMVEWVTAGDSRVCPQCQPLSGVVLKISEARGSIPRHPNCRCAWVPANVGEGKGGQQRGRKAVEQAIDKSVAAETGEKGRDASRWTGADTKIAETRPKSVLDTPKKETTKAPEYKTATTEQIDRMSKPVLVKYLVRSENVSEGFQQQIIQSLQALPKAELQALARGQVGIAVGKRLSAASPYLQGTRLSSWGADATIDQAEGIFHWKNKEVTMAEFRVLQGKEQRARINTLQILHHEIGHGFDAIGKTVSVSPEFWAVYSKEAKALIGTPRGNQLAYVIQAEEGGPSYAGGGEAFAEGYAASRSGSVLGKEFEAAFPKTIQWVDKYVKGLK